MNYDNTYLFQVREVAASTVAGLVQCGFIKCIKKLKVLQKI